MWEQFTISMVMFHRNVKLPEGRLIVTSASLEHPPASNAKFCRETDNQAWKMTCAGKVMVERLEITRLVSGRYSG